MSHSTPTVSGNGWLRCVTSTQFLAALTITTGVNGYSRVFFMPYSNDFSFIVSDGAHMLLCLYDFELSSLHKLMNYYELSLSLGLVFSVIWN